MCTQPTQYTTREPICIVPTQHVTLSKLWRVGTYNELYVISLVVRRYIICSTWKNVSPLRHVLLCFYPSVRPYICLYCACFVICLYSILRPDDTFEALSLTCFLPDIQNYLKLFLGYGVDKKTWQTDWQMEYKSGIDIREGEEIHYTWRKKFYTVKDTAKSGQTATG